MEEFLTCRRRPCCPALLGMLRDFFRFPQKCPLLLLLHSLIALIVHIVLIITITLIIPIILHFPPLLSLYYTSLPLHLWLGCISIPDYDQRHLHVRYSPKQCLLPLQPSSTTPQTFAR